MEPTLPVAPAPTPEPTADQAPAPVFIDSQHQVSTIKKKSKLKPILMTVVVLLLICGAASAGFYGHNKIVKPAPTPAPTPMAVDLPKDAMVTAECVAGRGKQYIQTKDIPDGPIYDVVNGKVVAVEYLVGLTELLAKPGNFTGLDLHMGTFDHVAVVPMDAHAGMDQQHFHVINYLISVNESKAITCAASSSTTTTTHANMAM